MDEINNNEASEGRDGVRLVGRREAEAAIQAGQAIGRNTVAKAPVVINEPRAVDLRDELRLDSDELRQDRAVEMTEEQMSGPSDEWPNDEDELPEAGSSASLPHWTEPATGEVPAVLREMDETEPEVTQQTQWSFSSLGEASGLADEPNNTDDFENFDDDPFDVISTSPFRETEEAPAFGVTTSSEQVPESELLESALTAEGATPSRPSAADVTMEKVELLKKSSLSQRLGTGIAFAVLAGAAFAAGPKYVLALCSLTVLLAAMEYFDAVRRVGYRPPTALGLMSVAGAMFGVYARGEAAIPLVLALVTFFTFLWYLTGVSEQRPTANIGVTLLGIVWTGIFGSFAALLLREPDRHGVAFILGGVLCVIAYDTAAYIGGTLFGKHLLIPHISPGKTWEGLACATVASLLVGALVVQAIHPWSFKGGVLLGIVVAIVAPIGDLSESMVKRDLNLKDMGRILPGHGGVFDRFDAMLLVLPATYYLVRMLHLS